MIYLFTNLEYGRPFIYTARHVVMVEPLEIMVVLSQKRSRFHWTLSGLKAAVAQRVEAEINRRFVARRFGLPTKSIRNINESSFVRGIAREDHGIVAGFNQIFGPGLIGRFRSLVNFHPSLLPYYRGPTPAYWCIENSEAQSGYSLHEIGEEIDRGEILYQDTVPIESNDDPDSLTLRIGVKAQAVFREYLLALARGQEFERRTVDASRIYTNRVDYKSFPERTR